MTQMLEALSQRRRSKRRTIRLPVQQIVLDEQIKAEEVTGEADLTRWLLKAACNAKMTDAASGWVCENK